MRFPRLFRFRHNLGFKSSPLPPCAPCKYRCSSHSVPDRVKSHPRSRTSSDLASTKTIWQEHRHVCPNISAKLPHSTTTLLETNSFARREYIIRLAHPSRPAWFHSGRFAISIFFQFSKKILRSWGNLMEELCTCIFWCVSIIGSSYEERMGAQYECEWHNKAHCEVPANGYQHG